MSESAYNGRKYFKPPERVVGRFVEVTVYVKLPWIEMFWIKTFLHTFFPVSKFSDTAKSPDDSCLVRGCVCKQEREY